MNIEDAEYLKYQKLVVGKNINPQTLLATDYLNHFNEIHMLLGMLADLPDCLDDIINWKAISYQKHFEQSIFQDKDLAIQAYNHVPTRYKLPFEQHIAEMDNLLLSTIAVVQKAVKIDNMEKVRKVVNDYSPKMENLIEQCSAIINSKKTTTQQEHIDDYFLPVENNENKNTIDQNSIDDLFN